MQGQLPCFKHVMSWENYSLSDHVHNKQQRVEKQTTFILKLRLLRRLAKPQDVGPDDSEGKTIWSVLCQSCGRRERRKITPSKVGKNPLLLGSIQFYISYV